MAHIYENTQPSELIDPHEDRTAVAYRDNLTEGLVDDAVESLIVMRAGSPNDGGAQLSVLTSLIEELDSRVPEAVFAARDQGYTWQEIAERLRVAESTARQHYGDHVRCREAEKPPFDD
jgi:DNA-directed RNA polymerase specialized sigma24 family protein